MYTVSSTPVMQRPPQGSCHLAVPEIQAIKKLPTACTKSLLKIIKEERFIYLKTKQNKTETEL